LGAVRHKGFIPWDDDLDVMFLHDDYERFYEACKTDLDTTRFFFQDYRNDPGYRWGYGKIRRLGTEYIKAGQEKLKQRTGICIDVFDFENVPDNSTERKRFVRQMFVIRKILYSALGRTNERHAILRLWYSILYYLIPSSFAHKIRTKITAKYLDQDTQNVACMMWPIKKYPYGFPCSLFASHIDLEFEGIKAMAIQGYDEYLRMRYGDYMKLPPEDQRRGVMEAVEYRFIDITHEEILEEYSLHGSKK
jgi:lipopolysaccharide cholinephosphotransferase